MADVTGKTEPNDHRRSGQLDREQRERATIDGR